MAPTFSGDDIFKRIFTKGKFCDLIKDTPKYVGKGPIDCKSVLVQMLAWRQTDDKLLPEPIMSQLPGASFTNMALLGLGHE